MQIQYSYIPIVDVECTCYEVNAWPSGQVQEIIEIGVAVLNTQTLEIGEKKSYLIPPTQSEVSPFCTKLTTLTPAMFDKTQPQEHTLWTFQEACTDLTRLTQDTAWGSWGDFDRLMFEKQCAQQNIKYPFSKTHINIKAMFSLFVGKTHGVGMLKACRVTGLPVRGTHHRGHDDAYNIAQVFRWMLQHRDA
jgi:inhibitor of KinA sporulation pathway (predicted exonuclease)